MNDVGHNLKSLKVESIVSVIPSLEKNTKSLYTVRTRVKQNFGHHNADTDNTVAWWDRTLDADS